MCMGFFDMYLIFKLNICFLGNERYLKRFLDVFRFILAEYELIFSHGDPEHSKFYKCYDRLKYHIKGFTYF